MKQRNKIGRILFYLGVFLLIYGIITAFINAYYVSYVDHYGNEEYTFEWRIFLQMIPTAIVNGAIFIGMSEVIRLLDLIYRKKQPLPNLTVEKTEETIPAVTKEEWNLDEKDKEKIYRLYANQAILEMTPSKIKGLCIVRLQDFTGPLDPVLKVVDVRDEEAREVENEDRIKLALEGYNA